MTTTARRADESPPIDVTRGFYRISLPALRVTAIVIGEAFRLIDRATDGLTCECGQPRRAHRHLRPGLDAAGCERWTWAGWRHG